MIDGLSYSNNFILAEQGIYFISGALELPNARQVLFYDYSTTRRKVLRAVEKSISYGIALSPDGRWLVHSLVGHVTSNLILVENYR